MERDDPRGVESGTRLAYQHAEGDSPQRADEDSVLVERGSVSQVRGASVHLRRSASAITLGRDVSLSQSAGAVVAGAQLKVEQSATQWLVAGVVQARQTFAVAVIAAKVEGQVRCLFDARGAFAFGAGVALMTGLLRLVVRRR
jgi:hypothetical protein